jgi:hypothetical protein
MIIWGKGGAEKDLGFFEHHACPACANKERPFKLLLQYRYAHNYWLRWVTLKQYRMACEVCQQGWELKAADVEPRLTKHPIPFMTRYGWTILAAFLLVMVALAVGCTSSGGVREVAYQQTDLPYQKAIEILIHPEKDSEVTRLALATSDCSS